MTTGATFASERSAAAGVVRRSDLMVHRELVAFIEEEVLPGTAVEADTFWTGLSNLVHRFGPRNRELLRRRAELQQAIDEWHRERLGRTHDPDEYRDFLIEIGYVVPQGEPFQIETGGVDPEIATIAGPQLVVPATNARYSLNAANARWGSLYDALYGTDALGDPPPPGGYDAARGGRVIGWVREFLDEAVPLERGSHAEVDSYVIIDGRLEATIGTTNAGLHDPTVLVGFLGEPDAPSAVLLRHHGLHIELRIDRAGAIGSHDRAGIQDVRLESAVTTIIDLEDSVATVDAADKVLAYRNWLGLMKRDLAAEVTKGGTTTLRRLNDDATFWAASGGEVTVRARSLLLVRNVGLLTTTPAIRDSDGDEVFEGLLDGAVCALIAKHDLARPVPERNSPNGSIYVVKPKLHGPKEVAFTDEVFGYIEEFLGLRPDTIKVGLMDEERRTSVNLSECVRAARRRLAFINTGFLDRTGDEIHTSMEAGPMVRKADMKAQPWIAAYEHQNVDVGLACGLRGRAQIGKGMWAAPDLMSRMLSEKVDHPLAGANCAWVPSPTAATLHATHYHRVDVAARQRELAGRTRTSLADLLTIPVVAEPAWNDDEIREEIENNAQGILGYVVRWIDQGIGCSKVPDIHDVALMEDRATCRISSQLIANWIRHGVVTVDEVDAALARMAAVVDAQNAESAGYRPMAPSCDGRAFRAARDLIMHGTEQPSGYTEPILHAARLAVKTEDTSNLKTGGNS